MRSSDSSKSVVRRAKDKKGTQFICSRNTAMTVGKIQAVIASVARRARLKRVAASAHTLRHTFALGYLRDNPGKLVELASLLGHESLDTTAIFTRPIRIDLAIGLEGLQLNVDGRFYDGHQPYKPRNVPS